MDGEVLHKPPAGHPPALAQLSWGSEILWQQRQFLAEIVVNAVVSAAAPRTLTLRPGFPAGPGGPWMPRGPCDAARREEEMPSPKGTTDGPSACGLHCWGCEGHRGYKMGPEPLEQSPRFNLHRKGSGLSTSGEKLHAFIHEEAFAP